MIKYFLYKIKDLLIIKYTVVTLLNYWTKFSNIKVQLKTAYIGTFSSFLFGYARKGPWRDLFTTRPLWYAKEKLIEYCTYSYYQTYPCTMHRNNNTILLVTSHKPTLTATCHVLQNYSGSQITILLSSQYIVVTNRPIFPSVCV